MTLTLHAHPYDITAYGFYFDSYEAYAEKAAKAVNAYGGPVEEFEIQFIDGEDIDCELAKIMTLQFIELNQLTVSPLNMRKLGAKDWDDLVSSICAMGVLQPLLVRPADEGFEVIAGQRRLNACRIIAENGAIDPIPCLVMRDHDAAAAIEASLAENIERLPMDEVDQYKAFAKLVKEGRDADEIATTFGITRRMVAQRLALGRLHPPILTAYRKGAIHKGDMRNLTMATPKQQQDWWALMKDEDAYAPTGQRLKDWLFGGAQIPIANALFDVNESGLAVVADLFGEDSYFAEAEAFWA